MVSIAAKRILIVEDNGLVGEVIADAIAEAGGCPIGPVLTENEALDLIDHEGKAPDAAVLDVDLDGSSFHVAERLRRLGVPFIFATGNAKEIPDAFRAAPVCEKPYTARSLLRALESALRH